MSETSLERCKARGLLHEDQVGKAGSGTFLSDVDSCGGLKAVTVV